MALPDALPVRTQVPGFSGGFFRGPITASDVHAGAAVPGVRRSGRIISGPSDAAQQRQQPVRTRVRRLLAAVVMDGCVCA
jgi:hypothetical protein